MDRRIAPSAALAAALFCAAAAWGVGIADFALPAANGGPTGIVLGPDGALWFTEQGTSKIGRITTGGSVTEFPTLTPQAAPTGITAGPDGALWFTELVANQIGRVTTAGALSEYTIPTPASEPQDIAAGPDGALWFTETNANKIGRLTISGIFTEYILPPPAGPLHIAAGPDGAVWFTESAAGANKIGRITPKGVIAEFPVPTPDSQPFAITAGPDGALWFTERFAGKIGRITTAGVVSEPLVVDVGSGITSGPDGNLWFTQPDSNRIGSVSPSGSTAEFPLPTPNAGPQGITTGPHGDLWFAEASVARIGSATFGCAPGFATLCLDDQPGDRRWQIAVAFSTVEGGGASGNGSAIPLASLGVARGGLFWFFNADNPEMLVKVLDGCALNQQFWVFASAATNVGFTITVTDTRTARARSYSNRDGTAALPVQDTSAFTCVAGDAGIAKGGTPEREPADAPHAAGAPVSVATPAAASAAASATAHSPDAATCAPSATAACIDGRFLLEVKYRAGGGRSGSAQAIALDGLGVSQGGLFWFFAPDNPEMLIKVLDGCGVNGQFWIFYAAGTNVGFTVTVTDTRNRRQRTYVNVNGTAALPLQDTSALACP